MENDPKKILLIDDSALMRRVMSDIINHIDGFTVAYLAADGEEGYAYLSKQNDIDVVMTDIRSEERRVGKECRSRWSPYH